MTEFTSAAADEAAGWPADDSAEPIVIRKLDRLETTYATNPNGA